MPKATEIALDLLKRWVFASKSRGKTLISGNATAGQRAAPARLGKNDANIGVRLDHGETYERDGQMLKSLKLQPNINAESPTLKRMAQEDPHQVLAEIEFPVRDNPTDEEVVDDVEDIFAKIGEKLKK